MYLRLYPKKNNSLFYAQGGSQIAASGLINTGANPIMQLMDGNYQGLTALQFVISDDLADKLSQYEYTAKLKLWDSGYVPGFEQMPPLTYTLSKNTDDFQEGSGYFFLGKDAVTGTSNYHFRNDSNDVWSANRQMA